MHVHPAELNILDLLPQRPPYIMVDRLTHYDPKTATTLFTVREDNLFCRNGLMEEAGLVENIAQTCAARTGFKHFLEHTDKENDKIKIGVIGMISSMEMKRCPLVGETLETSMVIEEEIFSITFVSAEVKIDGIPVASCRMKLFLKDEAPD